MSTHQRDSSNASLILIGAGIPCFLLGLIVLSQRQALAALLFGARFLFGIPLTGADSLKVQAVAFGSTIWMLMSLALIVAGVVVLLRGPRAASEPQSADAVTAPR